MKCENAKFIKKGMTQMMVCAIDNEVCPHTRYCVAQKKIVNTDKCSTCTNLNKEKG